MMMVGCGRRWPEVMGCGDDVVMVAAVEDGGVTSGRDGSVVEVVFGGEGLGWRRLVVNDNDVDGDVMAGWRSRWCGW
ncbi:hypothetical protein Tco_1170429 [Tanacetum coccineum]